MTTTSTIQVKYVTRKQASAVLADHGIPVAPATLATMATRGGGPSFRKFGQRVLYRPEDLVAWAERRLGPMMGSTSEADA
jgi:hypothetical protein